MSGRKSMTKEEKAGYFRNIVAMACWDGEIKEKEKSLLNYVAGELGIEEGAITDLMDTSGDVEFAVSEDPEVRFDQLFDLTEMMIIDGVMKSTEKEFCISMAGRLGYQPESVDMIVKSIIDGNRSLKNPDEIRAAARRAVSTFS